MVWECGGTPVVGGDFGGSVCSFVDGRPSGQGTGGVVVPSGSRSVVIEPGGVGAEWIDVTEVGWGDADELELGVPVGNRDEVAASCGAAGGLVTDIEPGGLVSPPSPGCDGGRHLH